MRWSDVTAIPTTKRLREFAGLCLVILVALAAWRIYRGQAGPGTMALGAFGLVVGTLGLIAPQAIRWVYTGWMVVAFPIGWTVSRLMLAGMFFGVFTPAALVLRSAGRDVLRLKRDKKDTYWTEKPQVTNVREYFRQF